MDLGIWISLEYMPDKGADAARAALGGRTPRRSLGTLALCNQGNDGNCCCSQLLAAEKMGNEWSSEELGSPWSWLVDIRSPSTLCLRHGASARF